jgi:hypothetical protein
MAEGGALATRRVTAEETPRNWTCGVPLHPRSWEQGQGQRQAAWQSASSEAEPSQQPVAATDTSHALDGLSASTQCETAKDHTSAASTSTAWSFA